MSVLYNHFQSQIKNELKKEASYISAGIEAEGESYISRITDEDTRITLITSGGEVIADTSVDAEKLENHLDREEVRQALETGSGFSIRYSDTLTKRVMYYAVKLSDGSILRVSATQYSAAAILISLAQPIALIIIVTLILSIILSGRIAKSIVKPINELDLDNPENNDTYDELAPLLRKISKQRKMINSQLREAKLQQEKFSLITENMTEGLLVTDKNMQLLTYNSAALRLLEIEKPLNGNVLVFNRSRVFRETVESALDGKRTQNEMSSGCRRYNLIANPVYEDKKVIGAVIVILDITENAKREQLRREFTSNVSHELKTPLTSISGFAEMMMNGETSPETTADFARSIYDEAQRLIALVLDILRISELDERDSGFVNEPVDLYGLSQEIARRIKPQADRKNVKINIIGNNIMIVGVKKILDEMIFNLCDNAVKYNKPDGTVDIVISRDENGTALTVRDTGIGIPKEHQSRIFERFYRVDKARSKAIGGTGLGLSIVKHGAICHNAEIKLESEENIGTTVSIIFPS
ncbi:MAG: ATP-binding protein [Porcipelethomonas sp.]